MKNDLLDATNAILVMKEGLVVVDSNYNKFKINNDTVTIKGDNVRYKLSIKEFIDLYKEKKFIILDDDEGEIDIKKDEEYYNFKHK